MKIEKSANCKQELLNKIKEKYYQEQLKKRIEQQKINENSIDYQIHKLFLLV
jgi:hypothetical protein